MSSEAFPSSARSSKKKAKEDLPQSRIQPSQPKLLWRSRQERKEGFYARAPSTFVKTSADKSGATQMFIPQGRGERREFVCFSRQ
jgi:hypothetical protein